MIGLAFLRPYLSIIADSFRAALASRVLWAAMLAIWLLLAALAPIGNREDYTTSFRWFDLYNGTRMKALLAQGLVDPAQADTPVGRLARAMPDELRRQLQRVGEGEEVRIALSALTDALNELIEQNATLATDDDSKSATNRWYDPSAWEQTARLRELRELDAADAGDLSESLRRRRARLRIEAALPGVFEARSARSVLLTYAGLEFPTGFAIDRNQFEMIFNQFVIPTLVHWLLGLVLVFIGVLVTASIIPEMLQPGSLHLLLSKPISRTGLLLSKFIGGCAFVFLCVGQLVIGLYLIAGWRLDIWNPRILWCVPVSLVMFAVFFSVSVPAGLKWRSPIISIAAAGGLAAVCFLVGIVNGVFEARVVQPDRIRSLAVVGEHWFAVTEGSGLIRYDREENRWVEEIESEVMSRDRVLDPVALNEQTVLTARVRNGRLNPFGSGALDLLALDERQQWTPTPTLRLPTGTERLTVLPDQSVLAMNSADLSLASGTQLLQTLGVEISAETAPQETDASDGPSREGDPDGESRPAAAGQSESRSSVGRIGNWLKTLVTMQGGSTADFRSILPPEVVLRPPTRTAVVIEEENGDRRTDHLLVMSADRLQRLSRPEAAGPSQTGLVWEVTATSELPSYDSADPVFLAATSDLVVSGRGDGRVQLDSPADLTRLARVLIPDDLTPLTVVPLRSGRSGRDNLFAVQTVEGEVRILAVSPAAEVASQSGNNELPSAGDGPPAADGTTEGNSFVRWSRPLPVADVEAIQFDRETGQLLIAHEIDRLAVAHFPADKPAGESAGESADGAYAQDGRPNDERLRPPGRSRDLLPEIRYYRPSLSYWRAVDRYGVGTVRLVTPRVLELGELAAAMVSGQDSLVVDQDESGSADVVQYQTTGPLVSCLLFITVMLSLSCLAFKRQDF